jgi:hypothetical protein
VSSAICAVLPSDSVICTLRSGAGAWRHPKVPIGWNLRCHPHDRSGRRAVNESITRLSRNR